jgi:(p)ppGpp synthase/HD superfamily hydrolase
MSWGTGARRPWCSVRAAVDVAFSAHDGQQRKSGEPFVTHPVAVAGILADMRMDHETLIAGLLHDTVRSVNAQN